MKRLLNESDDTYFMRVYRYYENLFPGINTRVLYLGVCKETGLPCIHPITQLFYLYPGYILPSVAQWYKLNQPSSYNYGREGLDYPLSLQYAEYDRCHGDSKYYERAFYKSYCDVCGAWMPSDPVALGTRQYLKL